MQQTAPPSTNLQKGITEQSPSLIYRPKFSRNPNPKAEGEKNFKRKKTGNNESSTFFLPKSVAAKNAALGSSSSLFIDAYQKYEFECGNRKGTRGKAFFLRVLKIIVLVLKNYWGELEIFFFFFFFFLFSSAESSK